MFGAYTSIPHKEPIGITAKKEPVVLQLQPPQDAQERKALVESVIPSAMLPEIKTNIAEDNAVATDTILYEGDESAPRFDKIDDIDMLPVKERTPQEPSPLSDATPELEETKAEEKSTPDTPIIEALPDELEADVLQLVQKKPEKKTETKEKPKAEPRERVQVAREQSIPSLPVPPTPPAQDTPHEGRSRDANRGVEQVGLAGYEAIQDDLAPYLKNMKAQVDLYWKEKLLLHYTGSKPTKVEIDCEIDHNGHLVKVEIVGNPKDKIYAALCKQALVLASPYGPFTFEVPDVYRNQNLEIRWSFNFL